MRKIAQRFVSWILSLAIIFSLVPVAYATDAFDKKTVSVDISMTEEESARAIYEGLTEEARQIFLIQVSSDPQLIEYHRENVDAFFEPIDVPVAYAGNNELAIVQNGLAALGLPTAVTYSFEALASQLVAESSAGIAMAVPQIYGIIIISSIAFGIANYWGQIVTLFNQIVAVFQEAFSSMSNEVATAMGQLAEDTDCIANSVLTGTVWVEGQTICIERGGQTDKYPCSTKIEAMPQPNSPYFPALLVRVGRSNMLFVSQRPANIAVALIIKAANLDTVGVYTYYEGCAKGLAQVNAPGTVLHTNDRHMDNPNYAPHYHSLKRNAVRPNDSEAFHAWFPR